jgi:hypothetical protein
MTMATQDQTIEFGEDPVGVTAEDNVWGRLLPVSANAKVIVFTSDNDSYTIGRSSQCSAVIADPGTQSRRSLLPRICPEPLSALISDISFWPHISRFIDSIFMRGIGSLSPRQSSTLGCDLVILSLFPFIPSLDLFSSFFSPFPISFIGIFLIWSRNGRVVAPKASALVDRPLLLGFLDSFLPQSLALALSLLRLFQTLFFSIGLS